MKYIRSCMSYAGSKYKLLPQLLPLFPKDINIFWDAFCGSCTVGINVPSKKTIFVDKDMHLIDLMKNIKSSSSYELLEEIQAVLDDYDMPKGFYDLRTDFNNGYDAWQYYYTLVVHSYCGTARFNSKGQFNNPFGRRTFLPKKNDFLNFKAALDAKKAFFVCGNFDYVRIAEPDDFVYFDPPYTIADSPYNNGWTTKNEDVLLKLAETLDRNGVRWAMSNVLENKDVTNFKLCEWLLDTGFKVHPMNINYDRCSGTAKKIGTKEVLITNY